MPTIGKQFSNYRADGMPQPMTPSMFASPTPKPTPTSASKPAPTPTPQPKKLYVGGGMAGGYRPVGSGNSAAVGGFLGGGGGNFGSLL